MSLAGLVPALEGVDAGHVAVLVAGLDLVADLVVALLDGVALALDVGVLVDGLGGLRVDRGVLAGHEVLVGVGEVPQVGHGVRP